MNRCGQFAADVPSAAHAPRQQSHRLPACQGSPKHNLSFRRRHGALARLLGLSIELVYWNLAQVEVLYTSKIDCCNGIALGISTFAEGVNPALCTEAMLDDVLVKGVCAGVGFWCLESQRCSGNEPKE